MSTLHLVPDDIRELYHVKEWRNAAGVLSTACPGEWQDMLQVLRGFTLLQSEILKKGGRHSPVAKRIDSAFYGLGWKERKFDTAITIDDHAPAPRTRSTASKGVLALKSNGTTKIHSSIAT